MAEKEKIKSIANCKPSEFLRQTNAIRHYVDGWLKTIKFSDIRKHLPTIPDGATDEEVNKLIREQNHKNFSDILDAALEEHPEETLGVLALCCFLPAEDADNHPIDMYIEVIADLMESENVMRFFISLAKLGLRLGK
jgi:hypothetical protein